MKKAILFMCLGELGWEILRFSSILPYKKYVQYKDQDIKFIVLTRPDRFDLYGDNADILEPIQIDESKMMPDCYRLTGLDINEYNKIVLDFQMRYSNKYQIIEQIYPKVSGKDYLNKNQFSQKEMLFEFKPRKENKLLIDEYIPNDKPLVVIGPRFRENFPRNWDNWEEFYDLMYNNNFCKNFNFVICGKEPEYIKDTKNRFYDINNIQLTENSSLIGLSMIAIKRSILTVGSQSAIPNLSMILGTEVLEWGNERTRHTKTYNVTGTKVNFLDDIEYNLPAKDILNEMVKILKTKIK